MTGLTGFIDRAGTDDDRTRASNAIMERMESIATAQPKDGRAGREEALQVLMLAYESLNDASSLYLLRRAC